MQKAPGILEIESSRKGRLVRIKVAYDKDTTVNDEQDGTDSIQLTDYIQVLGILEGNVLKATRVWR